MTDKIRNEFANPTLDRSWLIDYRIYDKQGDGKAKLDHVEDMLGVLVGVRNVAFSTVLMDSWYVSKRLLLYIESLKKTYYCSMFLRHNRRVAVAGRLGTFTVRQNS